MEPDSPPSTRRNAISPTSQKVRVDATNTPYTNSTRIRRLAALPANKPQKCPDHPHIPLPEICKSCHDLEGNSKATGDGEVAKHNNTPVASQFNEEDLVAEFEEAWEANLEEENKKPEMFSENFDADLGKDADVGANTSAPKLDASIQQSIEEISPRQTASKGVVKDASTTILDPLQTASDIQSFMDLLNYQDDAGNTMLMHYDSDISDYPDPEKAMNPYTSPYAQTERQTGANVARTNNVEPKPHGNAFQPFGNRFSPYRAVDRKLYTQRATAREISSMHFRPLASYRPISMRPTAPVQILSSKIILRDTKGPPANRNSTYSERLALDPEDLQPRRAPAHPNPPRQRPRDFDRAPTLPAKSKAPSKRNLREVDSDSEELEPAPKKRVLGRWVYEEFEEVYSPPAKRKKSEKQQVPESPKQVGRNDKAAKKATRPPPTKRITHSQTSSSSSNASTASRGNTPEVVKKVTHPLHTKRTTRSQTSSSSSNVSTNSRGNTPEVVVADSEPKIRVSERLRANKPEIKKAEDKPAKKKQGKRIKTSKKAEKTISITSKDEDSVSELETIVVATGKRKRFSPSPNPPLKRRRTG